MLFTVGYEGHSMQQFRTELREAGVTLLVDVRESPVSRKPGFSKADLELALEESNIGYRHLRLLGCPRAIRERYKASGDWEAYTREFMEHLSRQHAALEELRALAVAQRTAVLCYEADYDRCHRTYVAREVAQRAGLRVWHITPTGIVEDTAARVA